MAQQVKIVGAPGYVNEFRADIVPGLHKVKVSGDSEPQTVVTTVVGDYHVIPSRYVEFVQE